MTPFFDPTRCPICAAILPERPLRCPACGVELTGHTVAELVTTLCRADSLVGQIRAEMQPVEDVVPLQRPLFPGHPAGQPPARSWFAGKSVGVILLILGALCVLAAGAVFIAVAWILLPLAVRTLILLLITGGFGLASYLALRRKLQATAEVMAATALGMFVLDLSAARRVGLLNLDDLGAGQYEILAGILMVLVAGAGAFAVRSRENWLSSLDAAVGLGLARAALGALSLAGSSNADSYAAPYAAATVTVTVAASVAYVACRRFRFPVAAASAAVVGVMAWTAAVAIGAAQASDNDGGDLARIGDAWPALGMALVAGLWSIRVSGSQARRVAACLSLAPLLLIFEIVGWSHDWVIGTVVMLTAFAMAALLSARVPAAWSSAVGASALVLGLSAIVGLLPSVLTLVARLALAMFGSWDGSAVLPLALGYVEVAPWLLPLTTLVVLALLPGVTVAGRRVSVGRPRVAGAFVATLAVLPILYGAGFWVSVAVLVALSALLLLAARLISDDVLLVLGLLLLVIMRICAYYDPLANPLAWTLVAMAALAWALSEHRTEVGAWFLGSSGVFALLGTAQWLAYAQVPWQYQGLVIVSVGSLGLIASQSLRQRRLVCEGISLTWALVGMAMADSSAFHRVLELTVLGVASGIVSYLSPDRRRAGWVSGVLLTLASWIRLTDSNVQMVEWYTLPAAAALLVYGIRRRRQVPQDSTWRCLGPGLTLALTPSLLVALGEPISWRGLFVGLASVAMVGLGVQARLAAPFALGAVGTGLLALRYVWPVAAFIPRWTLLFMIGGALLVAGMTWESRVNDVRTAGRYVRGLA